MTIFFRFSRASAVLSPTTILTISSLIWMTIFLPASMTIFFRFSRASVILGFNSSIVFLASALMLSPSFFIASFTFVGMVTDTPLRVHSSTKKAATSHTAVWTSRELTSLRHMLMKALVLTWLKQGRSGEEASVKSWAQRW